MASKNARRTQRRAAQAARGLVQLTSGPSPVTPGGIRPTAPNRTRQSARRLPALPAGEHLLPADATGPMGADPDWRVRLFRLTLGLGLVGGGVALLL